VPIVVVAKRRSKAQVSLFQVPIVIVLKAMGMASDQEIVQMVGTDPTYADLLAPSIQECAALGIFTQQQALEYCGAKVKTGRQMWVKTKRHKVGLTLLLRSLTLFAPLVTRACFYVL
jgi:DNA-directed RNA polymerase beta subunit